MKTTRIAIHGAAGRMGRAVIQAALAMDGIKLVAAIDRKDNPELGEDVASVVGQAPIGISVGYVIDPAAEPFEVLVDFTQPEATLSALELCVEHKKAMVIGTTGFSAAQRARIEAASKSIPICTAANFSIGVNVVLSLLGDAARLLGEPYDVEIVEGHHRHKTDAPSGTALAMGEEVARALGRNLRDVAVYGREGQTGARARQTIGFATVRGGDVIGDHTVMFLGEGERVEISHKATSRLNFAQGALRAAAWLAGRKAGLYTMQDVLTG
ncbi:MAG: 4-hydroxy-tetrahydrodipicolinate reductase [Gammaproteobacteria bacterium]